MTKEYPIISYNNFLYMVEMAPKGNVYVMPAIPTVSKVSLVDMQPTGLPGLYSSMPHHLKVLASTSPLFKDIPQLPKIKERKYSLQDVRDAIFFAEGLGRRQLSNPTTNIMNYLSTISPKLMAIEVEMKIESYKYYNQKRLPETFKPKVDQNNKVQVRRWIYK